MMFLTTIEIPHRKGFFNQFLFDPFILPQMIPNFPEKSTDNRLKLGNNYTNRKLGIGKEVVIFGLN